MKKETEKKIWLGIGVLFVITLIIGVSYAYWKLNFEQTTPNTVNSGCFNIEFTEENPITLNNTYPMLEEEGMKTTPYTFKIQNMCNSKASYQINIESLVPSGKVLPDEYLKANLSEGEKSEITTKLQDEIQTEVTINGAVKAYKLLEGILNTNETKEYHLRLWMAEDVEAVDDSMNANYLGKVSIIASYYQDSDDTPNPVVPTPDVPPTSGVTLESFGINDPIVTEGSGLYQVEHPESEFTESFSADLNEEQISNLKMTEYRYAGSSPNNYVTFNNEYAGWRIIGLVNTPEGQRIKLMRDNSIGEYSWDSSDSSVNSGMGINEWSQADLNILLNNGAYYNRTSGTCYNAPNNVSTSCDFSSTGLTENAKEMIDTIKWNLGASVSDYDANITAKDFYSKERSNNTIKDFPAYGFCNDDITRTTSWEGQVALPYLSDIGYATSGGDGMSREVCLTQQIYSCRENWLAAKTAQHEYLALAVLLSVPEYLDGCSSTETPNNWRSGRGGAGIPRVVFPTIYLTSNVTITGGNGTQSNPYTLSM